MTRAVPGVPVPAGAVLRSRGRHGQREHHRERGHARERHPAQTGHFDPVLSVSDPALTVLRLLRLLRLQGDPPAFERVRSGRR